jgi:hypothetical protein
MIWNDLLILPIDKNDPSNDSIAIAIRGWRNRELAASDWTQLADVQLANYGEWLEYRKQLRDMMAQNEDPKLIVFPEPPK